MVKQIILGIIFAVLFSFNIFAQNTKLDSYEYGENSGKLRPYKITRIVSVVIKQNGKLGEKHSESNETVGECKVFKLKKHDVREFFLYARRISNYTYWNTINFSNCYAAGEIAFTNGDQGAWEIDAFRRGVLTLKDGSIIYFYCTKCTGKVFYDYE